MVEKIIQENEWPKMAESLLQISDHQSSRPTVWLLTGELGSGKTTLTQQTAKILGVKANLISPTYVLRRAYPISSSSFGQWRQIVHYDLYRLKTIAELLSLGLNNDLLMENNLIVIEWPELALADKTLTWPKTCLQVNLAHHDEQHRLISYRWL